ncbi:MAG: glutamate 5-kinase [Phycisphaerae bacterium]
MRAHIAAHCKRVVVKVGTNAICDSAGRLDAGAIENLAAQIAVAMKSGLAVTLVASGAIGSGMGEMGLPARPKTMPQLQATAAVGQGLLMQTFHDIFARHGVKVAQVLLTRDDFEHRTRYLNIRHTLAALEEFGALPIINENDTVAVEEIRFGENDILAALVATMLGADLAVFLTSVEGVLREGVVLDVIEQVDDSALSLVQVQKTHLGSGGMGTKLAAASVVTRAGEIAVIASSRTPNVLGRILAGEKIGTVFVPAKQRMSSRRRWIGHASRPAGKIVVDDGAARALTQQGKSLLPSGIVAVSGKFARGATLSVFDRRGNEIARGLANYSAEQVNKIKGLKTSAIAKALGDKPYDEVIHRNNMTVKT